MLQELPEHMNFPLVLHYLLLWHNIPKLITWYNQFRTLFRICITSAQHQNLLFLQVMESMLLFLHHQKHPRKLNQCRKVWRICVQRVHHLFIYISSHQDSHIIITFNILAFKSLSLTMLFLLSLLIEHFIPNIYGDQTRYRNLLNWQETIFFVAQLFMGTDKVFVMNFYNIL